LYKEVQAVGKENQGQMLQVAIQPTEGCKVKAPHILAQGNKLSRAIN
jgi:hypothetical protein